MKNIISIIAVTLLSGCADQTQQIDRQYHKAKAECLKPKLTRDNVVQEEMCMDRAFLYANEKLHSPLMGDAYDRVAAIHDAALDYAQGKIGIKEFNFRVKSADAKYSQAKARFDLQNQQLQAAQNQQQLQALMYISQSMSPPPPAYYAPTNCTTQYYKGMDQTSCY